MSVSTLSLLLLCTYITFTAEQDYEDVGKQEQGDGYNDGYISFQGYGDENKYQYGPTGQKGFYGYGNDGSNLDDPCFRNYSNRIIYNAQPFERRSMFDIIECTKLCIHNQALTAHFVCRSIVYCHKLMICDLYAHTGYDYPAKLVKYKGYDYLEFTDSVSCQKSLSLLSPITTMAPVTTRFIVAQQQDPCPTSQRSLFIFTRDYEYDGAPMHRTPGSTPALCADSCQSDTNCKAYQIRDGVCLRFRDSRALISSVGNLVAERMCFPAHVVTDCRVNNASIFQKFPNHSLVGYVDKVITASSVEDCLKQCTDRLHLCSSAMFYPEETSLNCILNTLSETTVDPSLFGPDRRDRVDFFSLRCNRSPTSTFAKRLLDQSSGGGWSEWSWCEEGRRSRHRFCDEGRVCGSQYQRCLSHT